jgi:uncharacterized cupin superfamily protein
MNRRSGFVWGKWIGLALCAVLLVAVPAASEKSEKEAAQAVVVPVRLDPEKIAGVDLPLEEKFIPPESILEGNHRPRGEVLFRGEQLIVEIYEDEAATFAVSEPFAYDEFILIMSGKLILTDSGGQAHEYVAGDSLVVPKGFTGIWKMLGNYRELIAIERVAYESAYDAEGE